MRHQLITTLITKVGKHKRLALFIKSSLLLAVVDELIDKRKVNSAKKICKQRNLKLSADNFYKFSTTLSVFAKTSFKLIDILKKENNFSKGDTAIFGNDKIKFAVDISFPYAAHEVFAQGLDGNGIYGFKNREFLKENRTYTVFDIGANRGYASLYFAQEDWCKEVYAFELVLLRYQSMPKNQFV